MNFSLYSLPIEINTELHFIFKINKGRLDWNHGRNGPNSVLGWTATRRRLFYAYREKWLITIRIINSFLLCFKSNCNLAYAEHISHSSSSFSSSSTLGFKHRIQMQAIFPPAEGSDFLASCASCCVGGLKLPSGPVMWLGLSGLLWTSGHHFPLTHLLFQQRLGPSVRSKWDCSVETALRHFFLLMWSPLAGFTRWCCQEEIPANSSLPAFALSHFLLSFWVSLPWKFILCHVLLVKSAAQFILSLSGRSSRSHQGCSSAFPLHQPAFVRWCASSGLLLHLETDGEMAPVSPQYHESNNHARIYLFSFSFI